MDLFTTAVSLAGAKSPTDKLIDGIDLSPALFNQSISDRYINNHDILSQMSIRFDDT